MKWKKRSLYDIIQQAINLEFAVVPPRKVFSGEISQHLLWGEAEGWPHDNVLNVIAVSVLATNWHTDPLIDKYDKSDGLFCFHTNSYT